MEKRQKVNMFVWKDKNWCYVFVDDAFKHSDWFKGLCWSIFEFHTEDEADRALEDYVYNTDDLLFIYTDMFRAGKISRSESFDDWRDRVYEQDWYSTIYDGSYQWEDWLKDAVYYAGEKEWVDYAVKCTNCVWWWRCIHRDMLNYDYWDYVIDDNFKKLKELYKEYEQDNDDREDVKKAKERLKELVQVWYFTEKEVDACLKKFKNPDNARVFLEMNKEQMNKRERENLLKKIDKDDN